MVRQVCMTETLIVSNLMALWKLSIEGHEVLNELATGWCCIIAAL